MSNRLIYVSPAVFKDKTLPIPGLKNYLELQKLFPVHVGIKDRTGTLVTPFKQTVVNPLPAYDDTFKLSYTECAMLRVAELEQIHKNTGKPFKLLYSGGIDSSCILAAFIEYFGADKTSKILEICCSKESIYENPWMWDRYIAKHNFKLSSSHAHTDMWNDNVIMLMGECNDQLTVASMIKISWERFAGKENAFQYVDESLLRHYLNSETKIINELVLTNIIKVLKAAPFKLDNMFMIIWWLSMALVWDSISLRALAGTNRTNFPVNYFDHGLPQFYNTSNFQQWSFHYIKNFNEDVILDYKSPPKDMIIKLLDLPEYANKTKSNSFPRLHSMIPYGLMIDDQLTVHRNIEDFLQFAEPNNSFV